MKPATLLDIGDIMEVLRFTYGSADGLAYQISMKMRFGTYYYFVNPKKNAVIIFEHIQGTCAQFHVYSLKEARGKSLIAFARGCGKYMLDNTGLQSFITFVDKEDKAASRFASIMGLKQVGDLKEQLIYCVYREDFIKNGKE